MPDSKPEIAHTPTNPPPPATPAASDPESGDFEVVIELEEPEKAAVLYLDNSERAYVRQALRDRFGAAEVETWFERWIWSGTIRGAFVVEELAEIIPPCFEWLLAYIDLEVLAREWEDCCRLVFASDSRGMVHAFAWMEFHNLDPRSKRKG